MKRAMLSRFSSRIAVSVFVCIGAGLLFSADARAQLCIDDYDPAKHFRFHDCGGAPCGEFVGAGYDWSGIGRFSDHRYWITMLTPHVGITAHHARPPHPDDAGPGEDEVYFFKGDGPWATRVGPFQVEYVTARRNDPYGLTTEIGGSGSDLALIKLTESVTDHGIRTYAIQVYQNTDGSIDHDSYIGLDMFIWGRHDPFLAPLDSQKSMRLGFNKVDFVENVFGGSRRIRYKVNKPEDTDYLEYEAAIVEYDSGGPTFITTNGPVAPLVGVHHGQSNYTCETKFPSVFPHSRHRFSDAAVYWHHEAINAAISTITGGQESAFVIFRPAR